MEISYEIIDTAYPAFNSIDTETDGVAFEDFMQGVQQVKAALGELV